MVKSFSAAVMNSRFHIKDVKILLIIKYEGIAVNIRYIHFFMMIF